MSSSVAQKSTLRLSKFIEGPPLTSHVPNLAQSDEQLQTILRQMDSYESSRPSQRKSKSRSSSSSSSNSNSSTSSIPFLSTSGSKRTSQDYSPPLHLPTSASNKRFSGVRASLDLCNTFTALSSLSSDSSARSRGSTIAGMNILGTSDEGAMKDTQILKMKIKGRLRAWSRGKDDAGRSYGCTWGVMGMDWVIWNLSRLILSNGKSYDGMSYRFIVSIQRKMNMGKGHTHINTRKEGKTQY